MLWNQVSVSYCCPRCCRRGAWSVQLFDVWARIFCCPLWSSCVVRRYLVLKHLFWECRKTRAAEWVSQSGLSGAVFVLRCVMLWCAMLRCDVVRCLRLRCVGCIALWCVAWPGAALWCAALRCGAFRWVAFWCVALRCFVALCGVALRCVAFWDSVRSIERERLDLGSAGTTSNEVLPT